MICHTFAVQLEAIQKVTEAVTQGVLPMKEIMASTKRILDLKSKYDLSFESTTSATDQKQLFDQQKNYASMIYQQSTTLVRHNPATFPIKTELSKLVLITPAQLASSSGAVDSGDSDVEDCVTGSSYIAVIEAVSSNSSLEVVEIQFHQDVPLSPESEKIINTAYTVILATNNALINTHQRDFGKALGRKLGGKLIVIATCEPYDFLEDSRDIQNYIAIYEPTVPVQGSCRCHLWSQVC
jgi:beta-N-acetylhexosaminidase